MINIEFKKDGTYLKEVSIENEKTITEGNWLWLNKSDEAGLKNKEAIILMETKTVAMGISVTTKDIYPVDIFVFKRLSNSEFVLLIDQNNNYSFNNEEYSGIISFEKKK